MATTSKKTSIEIFGKVISLLLVGIILLTMFAGCSRTPEEEFEDRMERSVLQTDCTDMLQEKAIQLLESNGYTIKDSCIEAYFNDGIPVINMVVLSTNEINTFKVETDYQGPIVSAFEVGEQEISVYGEFLDILWYFESCDYTLDGDKIVVSY